VVPRSIPIIGPLTLPSSSAAAKTFGAEKETTEAAVINIFLIENLFFYLYLYIIYLFFFFFFSISPFVFIYKIKNIFILIYISYTAL